MEVDHYHGWKLVSLWLALMWLSISMLVGVAVQVNWILNAIS